MKTLTLALLAGITVALAGPAFAGRDGAQLMEQERAYKKTQVERLAKAKQEQQGLAGATGVPGKAETSGQSAKFRRDPSAHP